MFGPESLVSHPCMVVDGDAIYLVGGVGTEKEPIKAAYRLKNGHMRLLLTVPTNF